MPRRRALSRSFQRQALLLLLSILQLATSFTNLRPAIRNYEEISPPNTTVSGRARHLSRSPLRSDLREGTAPSEARPGFPPSSVSFSERMRREKEAEINRLKFRIAELKDAIEESRRRTEEAERLVDELKREGDAESAVNKGLIAQIRAQFENERERLTEELSSLTDEVQESKGESSEELSRLKSEVKYREKELRLKLSALESSLNEASDDVSRTEEQMEHLMSDKAEEMKLKQKEWKMMVNAIKSSTFQEKRALEKENWDLETRLDRAKLELVAAQKVGAKLKASCDVLEKKLRENRKSLTEKVEEFKQCIEADMMLYAQSKQAAKDKLASVAVEFQAKIDQNEKDAEAKFRSEREETARQLADMEKKAKRDRIALYQEKYEALAESRAEMYAALREAEVKLTTLQEDSDAKIHQAEQNAKQKVESVEQKMEKELADAKVQAEREKFALLLDKEEALSRTMEDADLKLLAVKKSLTNRINRVKEEVRETEEEMAEKESMISSYKDEQKSFRKLAWLSLKLARDRAWKFPRRLLKRQNTESN